MPEGPTTFLYPYQYFLLPCFSWVTTQQQRRHKGKCHRCGEEGHRDRDCCALKEAATAPAAQEPSGAADQPKTRPADATYAADFEGEGCLLAEEGTTHMQIVVAEAGLSAAPRKPS